MERSPSIYTLFPLDLVTTAVLRMSHKDSSRMFYVLLFSLGCVLLSFHQALIVSLGCVDSCGSHKFGFWVPNLYFNRGCAAVLLFSPPKFFPFPSLTTTTTLLQWP